MFANLFPKAFDNNRRISWLALALLALLALVKMAMGVNSVVNTRFVAESVDGIPLENFVGGGAEAVLGFFAVWGLGQILLASQGFLALIRYRSMVPLVYLLMLLEQGGRKVIFTLHPIVSAGGPVLEDGRVDPSLINQVLFGALAVGFVLSVMGKPHRAE